MQRSSSLQESVVEVNFVLMGVEGSGKTALAQQLLKGKFVPVHSSTTLETAIYTSRVDGAIYQLHLCDSSGSDAFQEHRAPYIALADGILLVYSITDKYSLNQLTNYVYEMCNSRKKFEKTNSIPLLLIGTGTDRPNDREVSIADARRVAAECIAVLGWKSTKPLRGNGREGLGSPPPNGASAEQSVLEISCKSHVAVAHAFHTAVQFVQAHRGGVRVPTVNTMYQKVGPRSLPLRVLGDTSVSSSIATDGDLSSDYSSDYSSCESEVIPAQRANVSIVSSVSRFLKQCTSQPLMNSVCDSKGMTVSNKNGGVTQSKSQSSICMDSKSENGKSKSIPVVAPQPISKTKPNSMGSSDKCSDDPEQLDDTVTTKDRGGKSGGENKAPDVVKGKSHRPTIFGKLGAGMEKVHWDSMCKANCFPIKSGKNCECIVI